MSQGGFALQPDRAEQFDELLGTGGALAVLVAKLPVRERIVQFAQGLVDHEQEALSILSYQTQVVPGLLQTREHCRAVFEYRYPALGSETAEQWVNARMERQLIWRRDRPPVGHFILEESVLRREVGGPDAMREQIHQILEYTAPVHSMQVMPTGRTPHACLDGPMVLLETPEHERLVYLEVQRATLSRREPAPPERTSRRVMNTAARRQNLTWFKSSYSGSQGGDCVEVATRSSSVHIRDSKTPHGPVLTVSPATWSGFLEQLTR